MNEYSASQIKRKMGNNKGSQEVCAMPKIKAPEFCLKFVPKTQKTDVKGCLRWKIHKIPIVDKTSDKNLMIHACGTDIWFNKRAMKPQNRAESVISCMEKGLLQRAQKGYLAPA